jgi:hypothetical protein
MASAGFRLDVQGLRGEGGRFISPNLNRALQNSLRAPLKAEAGRLRDALRKATPISRLEPGEKPSEYRAPVGALRKGWGRPEDLVAEGTSDTRLSVEITNPVRAPGMQHALLAVLMHGAKTHSYGPREKDKLIFPERAGYHHHQRGLYAQDASMRRPRGARPEQAGMVQADWVTHPGFKPQGIVSRALRSADAPGIKSRLQKGSAEAMLHIIEEFVGANGRRQSTERRVL